MFRDLAAQSGIDFGWSHHGRSPLDIQETIGHGCTFLDYDQDGLMDVLLVGDEECALYRNTGNGRFANVTQQSGLTVHGKLGGVAVGDYDNDGFPDVYITGYGCCRLYHNRGSRTGKVFEDVTSRAGVGERGPYDFASAAGFVDLDNDGRLDLIVGRYVQFSPSSKRFCKYRSVLSSCPVTYYPPDNPRVYRNLGNGTFSDATKQWGFDSLHGRCLGLSISWSDSSNGPLVYFANDEMPCDLMERHGRQYSNIGVISSTAYGHEGMRQAGMGADWGDYNNDGHPDLVVATFQNEPKSIYRFDAPGLYTEAASQLGVTYGTLPYIAWTMKFVDYDNDSWPDLFITNGHVLSNVAQFEPSHSYAQPLLLYHNEGGVRFRDAHAEGGPAFQSPVVGRGASIGDFDNDGLPDILVVNEEGKVLLLHNECSDHNHWIGIRLVGKRCNRDGVGAQVLVSAGGRSYLKVEQLCGGYYSGQDPRLLFGLGKSVAIDHIEVRWPDGHKDQISRPDRRLTADKYITIEEGARD